MSAMCAMCAVGWGVPTATDISLAWMPAASAFLSIPQTAWHIAPRFAILVFGAGHPAINYLLLLAIADDALGMARQTDRNTHCMKYVQHRMTLTHLERVQINTNITHMPHALGWKHVNYCEVGKLGSRLELNQTQTA